jgi:hypothetical protein
MKTLAILTICLLLILPKLSGQDPTLKPYKLKSGIIEYKYSGDKTGTATLYFDDYGVKSAMYSELVTRGEPSKTWMVSIGELQYMWDLSKPGKGMKMKNQTAELTAEAAKDGLDSFTEATYAKMGMVKSGTEIFLGKECTLFKSDMGKVLTWSGMLMLMDFKMGSYVSKQEAISVKTNIPVDGKYFIIPKEITFSEMPAF